MNLLVPSEPIESADDHAPAPYKPPRHASGTGIWVPKEVADWIPHAGLRTPSSWSVLLAIILRQFRYGPGATAYITIKDLCALTGYSPATIKRAIRVLRGQGVVRRRHRYGDVQFVMTNAVTGRIAKTIPPKDHHDDPSPNLYYLLNNGDVPTANHPTRKLDTKQYEGRLPQRISRESYLRAIALLVSKRTARSAI